MVGDINSAIADADNKIIIGKDDKLIRIDDLLVPEFSRCSRCPLYGGCPAQQESEEAEHCLIEEGLVIESTKELVGYYGITIKDKLVMFSFLINLLNLHRLSRMGAMIQFGLYEKDNFDIMNKYMAMVAKIDGRYHKALQELQATRKEQFRLAQIHTDETSTFMRVMTDLAKKSKEARRIENGNGNNPDKN
jgi:hypothetical protein